MEREGSSQNKMEDDGDDTVDMVIELSDLPDGINTQISEPTATEERETEDVKDKEVKKSEKVETKEDQEMDSYGKKKDEEIILDNKEKVDLVNEEEEKSKKMNLHKNNDSVKDEIVPKNEDIPNIVEDKEKSIEDKKKVEGDVENKRNEVEKNSEIKEKDINIEEKGITESIVGEKPNSEDVKEENSTKSLVVDDKVVNKIDIEEKDSQEMKDVKSNNEDGSIDNMKVTEELNKKEENEKNCVKDEADQVKKEENKGDESTVKEVNEAKKTDKTMGVEDNQDIQENKKEENLTKDIDKQKDESVGLAAKGNKETDSKTDIEEKQESGIPEIGENKGNGEKPSEEIPEELQMEVDDEDKHSDELPDQINFVDVNAPPPCESPLLIDDDDDDDDIICMVDKGKTSTKPRKRNRRKMRRDSSPEILQEDINKKRREIVIDLDDDDDDIEIETIKTRKKRNRTGRLKGNSCCNLECPNQDEDLRIAPVFVLTYYGRKYKKGRNEKVCGPCFEVAMQHNEHLSYLLSEHIPLFSAEFHLRNDTVVLTDSDEEGAQDDDYIPDEVLEDLQNQLPEVLEATIEKYDLDFQIKESEDFLNKKLDKLTAEFEETDNLLNEMQKKVDQLRYDVYKDYIPKIRELPALTIDDSQCGVKEPIIRLAAPSSVNQLQKPQHQFGRQQQQQKQPMIQNRIPVASSQNSLKQRYIPIQSQASSSSQDPFRKSPLTGVATKKVTQIQRSLGPSQPEMEKKSGMCKDVRSDRIDQIPQGSTVSEVGENWFPIENADHLGSEPEPMDQDISQIERNESSQKEKQAVMCTDVISGRIDETPICSPSTLSEVDKNWLPIENADQLGSEPDPVDQDMLQLGNMNEVYKTQIVSPGNDNPLGISPSQSPIPIYHSSCFNITQRQEDVVALEQVEVTHKPLPPIGPITRPKPRSGDIMYVMKLSFYGVWSRAKILEVVPKGTELSSGSLSMYNLYKVKFESSYRKSNPVKQVTGKQMAYTTPSPVRFPVGTRVIAIFQDNDWSKECYYSGVIAEPPKSMNNYRYLVFFDDGYAQYVTHEKILLVCESSRNVWEDIHPDSREFIRKYLEQYPERPMVKLQQGQIVKTEWNGKWWIARVVEVDGSLVKMHFDADGRTEWIYRGSTRLGPLYAELAHAAARKEQGTFSRHRGLGVASLKKRNMPYVEYTRGTEGEEIRRDDSGDGHMSESTPARAVAKKSTTKRPEGMDRGHEHSSIHSSMDKSQKPQGRVEYLQLNTSKRPRKFEPHQCGPNCLLGSEYDPKAMKGMNPLVIPMLCSWERQVNRCRGKRLVIYRAPCGRRLRNMEELHRYLRITKSNMAVDLFDFDFWVHCFAEFVLEKGFSNIKDLSYGTEYVPVPCVNCVDHSLPDYVSYSTKREPTDGVHLNLDTEFLTGCDCTDDCQDRDKCACWQLTIQGTAYGPGGAVDPTVGYIYRRLPEPVMTGIYECNSRCKCSNTCLNRVAQQPLQLKLQVFKTENRGWGIRCLNDIPQGGFICIYAGKLLTEQGANEGGKNYGDEYLAELDYIEVVEKLKEGYESDVVDDDSDSPEEEKGAAEARKTKVTQVHSEPSASEEEEEEEAENSQGARDSDEEFQITTWSKQNSSSAHEQTSIRTRLRNRSSRHGSEDSQADGKDKEKDREDRDSDKASSDGKDSRRSEGHKKSSRSLSSSDHNYSDDEDSEQLRLPSRFAVISEPQEIDVSKKPKHISVREFFGMDEYCYIMDAKNLGNIGRYLNHSCSPNVFVQNVFVDTHDLRFPWVAFFALTYIHAGTELTWDYNYDVGSVPGKVLHCYCGSNDCRGRLL